MPWLDLASGRVGRVARQGSQHRSACCGDGQGYDAERRERAEALEPLFAKGIGVEVVGDDMPEQAADGGAKDLRDA